LMKRDIEIPRFLIVYKSSPRAMEETEVVWGAEEQSWEAVEEVLERYGFSVDENGKIFYNGWNLVRIIEIPRAEETEEELTHMNNCLKESSDRLIEDGWVMPAEERAERQLLEQLLRKYPKQC